MTACSRLTWLASLVIACGPKPSPARAGASDAIVYVKSNIADAQLFLDGQFVAPVGTLRAGIALDPGRHRLELRHDDYFSRYVDLDLHRAETQQLQLDMAPVLP